MFKKIKNQNTRKLLIIILSALIIIFILKAPKILQTYINNNQFVRSDLPEKSDWKGRIIIYNLMGENSQDNLDKKWLTKIITKFEKQNRGIFLEYKSVLFEDYINKKNLPSAKPDIILVGQNQNKNQNNLETIGTELGFALPEKKQEQSAIVEDFEFDITEENNKKNIVEKQEYNNFGVAFINTNDSKKLSKMLKFALFVADEAEVMIK